MELNGKTAPSKGETVIELGGEPKGSSDVQVESHRLDILSKLLALSGIAYAAGLVITNLSYSLAWGFHDFEIAHQQCIYAGLLFSVFICGSYLTGKLIEHVAELVRPKLRNGLTWAMISLTSLSVLLFVAYWIYHDVDRKTALKSLLLLIFFAGFITATTSLSILIWEGIPLKSRYRGSGVHEGAMLLTKLYYLFYLSFLFASLYQLIPSGLGGGRPETRDLLLSKEGAELFSLCGASRTTAALSDGSKLYSNVTVIYRSENEQIVKKCNCPIVRLRREWIKAELWTHKPGSS